MIRERIRVRFQKRGDLRWISHRDLVRVFERLMRRADLKLGMSQGFHPKARMSFPSALALGIESLDEVMEFELAEQVDSEELIRRLSEQAPNGLVITDVHLLEPGQRKARLRTATYRIPIPETQHSSLGDRIQELKNQSSCWIQRDAGRAPVDLKVGLDQLDFQDGILQFRLCVNEQGGVRPADVLQALELEGIQRSGCTLTRSEVEIMG